MARKSIGELIEDNGYEIFMWLMAGIFVLAPLVCMIGGVLKQDWLIWIGIGIGALCVAVCFAFYLIETLNEMRKKKANTTATPPTAPPAEEPVTVRKPAA